MTDGLCRCRNNLQPRTINEAKARSRVKFQEVAEPYVL